MTTKSFTPSVFATRPLIWTCALALHCFGVCSSARADTYSADTSDGYAWLDSQFGGNDLTLRVGSDHTMTVKMGTKGSTAIDYGTSFANIDQLVAGPWWLNGGLSNLRGDFGPDAATVRFLYRGDRHVFFHITYYPSYAEANIGFFWVHVRGCYAAFNSLPEGIQQGDGFTATAAGQDDEGRLSTVTVQVSENGGAWSTLGTAGAGNGWTSTSPATVLTAGVAGTTYQFRAWATDTNGYQSQIVTSAVYTTTPPPPPTNYVSPMGDIGFLFKVRVGGARAASTGLTCVINGTTYDLADLFQPRVTAPRAAVGFAAANGQDLAEIFEKK